MSLPSGDGVTEPYLDLHVFRIEEGLGNACLLEFPDGTCGFIDWGTQNDAPLEKALAIARRGRVRFVAATHAHADHTLGLMLLLQSCLDRHIAVERLIYPASTLHKNENYLNDARRFARRHGIPMHPIGVDINLEPPGRRTPPFLAWADDQSWAVQLLSPPIEAIAVAEIKALALDEVPGNETSMVILFHFLGKPHHAGLGHVMLCGDATPATLAFARKMAIEYRDLSLDNQALVVPHHGSRHNLPGWLQDHIHGVAVISAPTDSLHHPSPEVLQRLGDWTCNATSHKLFCTSYAQCCQTAFAARATPGESRLVQPGNCFGDIVIRVPASSPAFLYASSAVGAERRPFGYCGNVKSRQLPLGL